MAGIAAALVAIVFILVGVQIAQSTYNSATTLLSTTEALTYDEAPDLQTFTLTTVEDGVVTSSLVVSNATDNFTVSTDYNITEAGVLTFVNANNQSLNASYDYQPTGYIDTGTTRTVVSFIPLFIGLAALALAAFLFLRN